MSKQNQLVCIGGDKSVVTLDETGALTDNSDSAVPTQKAVKTYVDAHATAAVDTDATFAADSDVLVPSQKAVKTAFDALTGKTIEAANAAVVLPGNTAVLSTTGTTVLDLSAIADGQEFNLVSAAAQNMSLDFGVGVSVFAAGIAGTGARYVKFTNVIGTSIKLVRLSSTSFYALGVVGGVTIAAAP